ncbi:hypothetical protein [Candidatus Protochlamydia sp. W-9]|uniref:hypothetical protein n=1 Tax=Candidatus Protochlamydia sp. W-9 TaxID=1785087 RepID=UPI00096A6C14|nr:hypothetical protein [Candidatus Protochlamydia sp. W-9]
MAALHELIEGDKKVEVECLHYNCPSTAEINETQLTLLAIQLASYKSKQFPPLQLELSVALTILGIQVLTKEAIFDFMKKFAQAEQFPFMTKEEYQIAKSSNMI